MVVCILFQTIEYFFDALYYPLCNLWPIVSEVFAMIYD